MRYLQIAVSLCWASGLGLVSAQPPAPPKQPDAATKNHQRQLESRARSLLQQMQESANRGEQLECILARLHHSQEAINDFALLQQLARLQWPPGDLPALIEKASRQWTLTPSKTGKKFLDVGRQYVALGDEFPFNWRTRREFWLDLTVALARSQAADPDDVFNEFLVDLKNPTEQGFARLAYLAAIENSNTALNLDMVKPLFAVDSPMVAAHRLAEIHSVARLKGQNKEEMAALVWIWDRLPKLGKLDHNQREHEQLVRSLGTQVGRPLLTLLVNQASPQLFATFCDRAGLSKNETASQFLAKPTTVKLRQAPLRQALTELLDQVHLSVWVDVDLVTSPKFVDLTFAGVWKESMQATADSVGYHFTELSDGVFYLGPLNKVKLARPMIQRSRRQLPIEGTPEQWRATSALVEGTFSQMIDMPWHDALQVFSDLNDVKVQFEGVPNPPVTSLSRNLPPHLALSVLCYETDCQWTLTKDGVVRVTVDPNPPRAGDETERREAELPLP